MPVNDEFNHLSMQVHRKLVATPSFYKAALAREPFWYGRMLTGIALLLEGDEIEYITGRRSEHATAEVVVVTSTRIVYTSVLDIAGDDGTIKSEVWSRASVVSVALTAEDSVFNTDAFADWPGPLTIEFTFHHGPTIKLPLDRTTESDEPGQLRELLRASIRKLDGPNHLSAD